MVLTRSSRKRRKSLRNCFRRRLLFFFSRVDNRRFLSTSCSSSMAPKHERFGSMYVSHFSMTGKSLLRLTFWSRQYRNWESSQTPDSHNRHAQSPVQWSCLQIKQHRQWLENDESWKLPPTPRVDYQMRIKPGVIRKNSCFAPVEMRNQLRMLLEIPSLLWSKTNQNYAQKTVQKLKLVQETMKVQQPP